MRKTLILVGGALNALFFLLHVLLEWSYHQASALSVNVRAPLEAFAIGGTVMVGFMAFVSLAFPHELLATKVGRSTSVVIILTYALRAAEEFVIFPRVSWLITIACLAVAGLYMAALLLPEPRQDQAQPVQQPEVMAQPH